MKLKDKIKSYSFWVSLASAIILILKLLGTRFGFSVDETMISDLFTALCSILVLLGIIVVPGYNQTNNSTETKTTKTTQNQHSEQLDSQTNFIMPNETNIEENESQTKSEEILLQNISIEKNENCIAEYDNTKSKSEDSEISFEESNFEKTQESYTSFQPNDISTENLCNSTLEINNINNSELSLTQDNKSNESHNPISDLKLTLSLEKEKFESNLDAYIFELQEEIRKTREGM